jgi:hypothetical protein
MQVAIPGVGFVSPKIWRFEFCHFALHRVKSRKAWYNHLVNITIMDKR